MGDEIEVKVVSIAENGFILTVPAVSQQITKSKSGSISSSRVDVNDLK
jgi:hypothetical protein